MAIFSKVFKKRRNREETLVWSVREFTERKESISIDWITVDRVPLHLDVTI